MTEGATKVTERTSADPQPGKPVSRVTRSKAEAESAYDRMSRFYDLLAGSSERPFTEKGLRRLALQEGESVLEIGYGTGSAIVAMAKAVGPSGRVFGIDLSGGMQQEATERARREGVEGLVDLRKGDAAALPFPAESMDAVFLSFTLELFDTPEMPAVLAECRRVLRLGGRIGVVAMQEKERSGVMLRLYKWAHARFPAAVDCRPIYAGDSLRRAGFRILHSEETSMWGLPVRVLLGEKPAGGRR
jgi:ubiquinone/menaquinone biosynthesis C-methylase UbiE